MMKTQNRYQNTAHIEKLEKEIAELEGAAQEEVDKQDKPVELSQEEQSFKKRYGDLRRFSQKREDELRKELESLKSEMTVLKRAKNELTAPVSDEEFDAWTAKYPDVYAKIVKAVEKQIKVSNHDLQEKLKQREEKELEYERANAYRELLSLHPDFDEIKVAEDFIEWAEKQPLWVYNALYNNDTDALAAARAVDLYKLDHKPKKEKKADKSDDARSVRSKAAGPDISSTPELRFTESSVAKMSWREYEKNEEAINEAMKNPAFYDLSGGAR